MLRVIPVLILLFTSCSSIHEVKSSGCKENIMFKKKFFYYISVADKYTVERTTGADHKIKTKAFLKALQFISNYTKVSMDKVLNYEIGYPSYEIFEIDKSKWIMWYDSNKCNNIK